MFLDEKLLYTSKYIDEMYCRFIEFDIQGIS